MKNKLLSIISFSVLSLFLSTNLFAQVGINNVDPKARLDISATSITTPINTDGLLIPRVDEFPASPTANQDGMMVYITGAGTPAEGFWYWDGAKWLTIDGGNNWGIKGNVGTSQLTDFIGTTDAQALVFKTNDVERFFMSQNNQFRSTSDGTAAIPNFTWNTDNNTGLYRIGDDILGFSTGGTEKLRLGTTEAVFNENGGDINFRIETDGQPDMFFIDAGTNQIGINKLAPIRQFDFESYSSTGWITRWNNDFTGGGLKLIYNTNSANFSRVVLGVTNYDASSYLVPGLMGMSINATTTGAGGIGINGHANNESGVAVYGSLFHANPTYGGWAGFFDADVGTIGGFWLVSDRKLKRDISPIKSALGIINQLAPVTYFYDTKRYPEMGMDENRLTYGFIAQDLKQVLPELVKEKNLILNSNTIKTAEENSAPLSSEKFNVVNYTLMIPVLTQAIKEQQLIIEEQNNRITELEKAIEEINRKLN